MLVILSLGSSREQTGKVAGEKFINFCYKDKTSQREVLMHLHYIKKHPAKKLAAK